MVCRLILGALLLLPLACSGESLGPDAAADGSAGDTGRDGGLDSGRYEPEDDPLCHWDCFGGRYCTDGVVYESVYGPIPCSAGTGGCPAVTLGVCPDGCGDRAPSTNSAGWQGFCEGSEERIVGDPCTTSDDCQPPALDRSSLPWRRLYLYCKSETSTCEVALLPPISPHRPETEDMLRLLTFRWPNLGD